MAPLPPINHSRWPSEARAGISAAGTSSGTRLIWTLRQEGLELRRRRFDVEADLAFTVPTAELEPRVVVHAVKPEGL